MDDQHFFSINLKIHKVSAILALGLIVFFSAIYYFTGVPHPITLDDPPFPRGVIVDYQETSTRVWYSGNKAESTSDIWRKEFMVGLQCCEELNTSEKILAFMDNWLATKGWVRWNEVGDPCGNVPETDFLQRGTGYIPYVPKDTESLTYSPSICIAVWPLEKGVYSVLMVTANR